MELKEFVTSVLVDLTQGIKDAQQKVSEFGGIVSPSFKGVGYEESVGNRPVHFVEFGVTLTEESKDGARGIGVSLASVASLNLSSKENKVNSNETHIQFKIPIVYPVSAINKRI